MKKLLLIILFAVSASLTITSCTEEDVKPTASCINGGGGASEPIKP